MKCKDLKTLTHRLEDFALERDWDKFHSPKNLVMALSGETGELVEVFQWLTEEESKNLSPKQKGLAEEELADIFLYLLRLSDKLDIDLIDVANKKLEVNGSKYPVESCYGTAKKYNEL
ncbi:nucleotide pyrophosphohydrolase [Vibrio parahaemolyticus]|uniref:nucleotide pyrophosphohydrolase n=1 Tax=Vibrio parahaemolyticus TaxID=670 RepID=UPI0003F84E38|nr:nucleotide pyrophosphohydrolase [Vibrio parahaemolyticus]EIF8963175.1 nucleotide pyrophosphohydrolase [Vibrio parahaemolyticus]EIV8508664.1 nucleotide pyrophosphohydrolase [Vibrio parahaemolyticus]EJR2787198.1 nucleotide pyrophosphohydrolase [Vibrio parahaemolyticus]MDT8848643.1 nucleotide pyrophosphohydrolase [Vibrio parahaemolyticus]MDT8921009.1 nucleotide pyrophosphohydrolase [Vibrio parahaemolyticus]